jgi:hypothetical protein
MNVDTRLGANRFMLVFFKSDMLKEVGITLVTQGG